MALTPLTERQKVLLVNNIVQAVTNINTLKQPAYNYLSCCSGFIAHYNRWGFIDHYSDYSLKENLVRNARQNQWLNFRPGERDYEYYMSKADVYRRVLEQIA